MSQRADGGDGRRSVAIRRLVLGATAAVVTGAAGYAASRLIARRQDSKRLRGTLPTAPPASPGTLSDVAVAPANELDLPPGVSHRYVDTTDGGRLHLIEAGTGPTIVLLHGAGLSAAVWAYQFRDLADRFRLVALDLRGHGESLPGSKGMTIGAMGDDLADALTALDANPALLVGHSMGGMAVLRFARQHRRILTDRVASVMLLSTAAGVVPNIAPWNYVGTLAGRAAVTAGGIVTRSGRTGLPEGEIGRAFCRAGFGVAPSAAQVDAVLKMMRAGEPGLLARLVPELMAFDERAVFEDLDVPVTVVVGSRDRVTPPALARRLAESLGGARLVVWPGGGHMLMYERREALDWLVERLASGAGAGDGTGMVDADREGRGERAVEAGATSSRTARERAGRGR